MTMNMNVQALLQQVNDADRKQVECQYDIANTLAAIRAHKLYEHAGYDTFKAMCEAELTFSYSYASKYITFFRVVNGFKYTKEEITELMREFSWQSILKVLDHSNRKLGRRAIAKRIEERDYSGGVQVGLHFQDRIALKNMDRALKQYGMTIDTETGRRYGVSAAMEALFNDIAKLPPTRRKLAEAA